MLKICELRSKWRYTTTLIKKQIEWPIAWSKREGENSNSARL